MQDFILDIEVKVTAKPVNAKVGATQRGPYERNLFVVRESTKKSYTGLKSDIATMAANAIKPISRQWPLGDTPPEINSISTPDPIAATTATLKANVTDGPVSFASAAAALVVVATAGTITRPSGDFLADGFLPGMTIVTTGFSESGNNGTWIIDTVTALVITVTVVTGLVDETGGGNEVVTVSKTGVFVEYGSDKTTLDTVKQAATSPISAEAAAAITFALTGLTESTQYFYRVVMVTQGLAVRSQLKTFTTIAS